MTSYLIKTLVMRGKRPPKIPSNSIQNHLWIKQGWNKYVNSCINNWGVKEEATLQNNGNIKILLHQYLRRSCCVIKIN